MSDRLTLRVNDLHAGYGSMEAVAGVSLEVSSGEIVSLIGRNGAGKTTTLMSIAGIRRGRDSCDISVGGITLSHASAAQVVAAGIAHVPEGHRIFRSLTVRENLQFGAYPQRRLGRKAVAASMERVFSLFPILGKYASRNAGFLSGGEQQMTAIGQALMASPRILMLDEPTSGLSLVVIKKILAVLEQLRDDGLGVLVVEQNVARALTHSDRVYVMERGRIAMRGVSSEMVKDERVFDIVRGTAELPTSALMGNADSDSDETSRSS